MLGVLGGWDLPTPRDIHKKKPYVEQKRPIPPRNAFISGSLSTGGRFVTRDKKIPVLVC